MEDSLLKSLPWIPADDPAENYHAAAKLSPWVSESFSGPYAFELANDPEALAGFGVPSSIVDSAERHPLAPATEPTPVGTVLRDRQSVTGFGPSQVDFGQLSRILLDTACTSPAGRRGAPSAGALYPLDVYLCVCGVRGLASGIYSLDPFAAELNRLRIGKDPRTFLSETLLFQDLAESSAFHVFFIASFARQRIKYGQRSYRFTLLEAGHLAQAMIMSAQESGIASCPVGGFIDQEVDDLLCLDGVEQSVVYSVAFGTARRRDAA
ncbi:MAG: SagB/ThcOx family dehydrogenase [Renibacterium salmoninarum]|nr:SagB/ThcOx family dehydrogenase [Renibacterium salmoninarum]